MTVAIDTSVLRQIRLRLFDQRGSQRIAFHAYADRALPELAKLLRGRRPAVIAVVTGPGAFSATRNGVALSNALAYAWNVPVVAITKDQFDDENFKPEIYNFRSRRIGLRSTRFTKSVSVIYAFGPNITKKKTPSLG